MTPVLPLLLVARALAAPSPEADSVSSPYPYDTLLVRAAAEAAWARLPRTPYRSWFACDGSGVFRRAGETVDPLAASCAEARDLARTAQVLTVRVERTGVAASTVTITGTVTGFPRVAERYQAAVEQLVRQAATPEHALHDVYARSLPEAVDDARVRVAVTGATEGCGRRLAWARERLPDGWVEAGLERIGAAPDGCAAEAAGALDGLVPGEAVAARVRARIEPAPGVVDDAARLALDTSWDAWPGPVRDALSLDRARWATLAREKVDAVAGARARRVEGLDAAGRACWEATRAALQSANVRAGAEVAEGTRVAWSVPVSLYEAGEGGGAVGDGRGGVAWRVRLPEGATLGGEGPQVLVTGTLRVSPAVDGSPGAPLVPLVDVACLPARDLPADLRPTWTVLGGWRLPGDPGEP